MKSFERFNANGPAGGRQLTMGKVSAALDYQRRQQSSGTTSTPAVPAAATHSSPLPDTNTLQQPQPQPSSSHIGDPLEGVTSLRDLDPDFPGSTATLADAIVGPAALHRQKDFETLASDLPASSPSAGPSTAGAVQAPSEAGAKSNAPVGQAPSQKAKPLPSASVGMPARVRAAVKAAEQYRQSKLKATVAAANAAAASAALPPSKKSKGSVTRKTNES